MAAMRLGSLKGHGAMRAAAQNSRLSGPDATNLARAARFLRLSAARAHRKGRQPRIPCSRARRITDNLEFRAAGRDALLTTSNSVQHTSARRAPRPPRAQKRPRPARSQTGPETQGKRHARALQLDRGALDRVISREVAGAVVAGGHLAQLGALLRADRLRDGAARVEAAAARRVDR